MSETPNEFGDGRPDIETVKQMRLDYPSGWLQLAQTPARAILIDALLDAPPDYEFTPPEIESRAGISDQSVRNHIDSLVDVGLVEHVSGSRYRVKDDGRVFRELEHLNSAVTAVRSGASEKTATKDPSKELDNSRRDRKQNTLITLPSSPGINANAI